MADSVFSSSIWMEVLIWSRGFAGGDGGAGEAVLEEVEVILGVWKASQLVD